MAKIKRSDFAAFLNTAPSGTAAYARMGKGITSQSLSYNPNSTTETYIDEDNATTNVDSYAPSLDATQTCYAGDGVFEFIDGLRKNRATGSDLETDVVLVYIYDAASNTYAAEKNSCIIQLGDFGGDGGGSLQITYTVALNGDPIQGTATISNTGVMAFTPSAG